MLIRLTNTNDAHRGEPLWINTDHIVSMYLHAEEAGGSLTTFLYTAHGKKHVTWRIEESPEQVAAMMRKRHG